MCLLSISLEIIASAPKAPENKPFSQAPKTPGAPHCLWGVKTLFCFAVLCFFPGYAIIPLEKREIVALLLLFSCYVVLLLFLAVPWSDLCVIVAFHGYTPLLLTIIIEGVTATRYFSHFLLFREKHEKHHLDFSQYIDFSCKNEQDMFEKSEFRRSCNYFKNLILVISFMQLRP